MPTSTFSSDAARSGVILALDHGDQRIGIALSDPEQQHALAHGVVAAQPRGGALAELERLIAAEGVDRIVVGLPLTLGGEEGAQAVTVRAFAGELATMTGLPLEFVDERFTSGDATRAAEEKGTAPDAEAARFILEAWLERRRTSP